MKDWFKHIVLFILLATFTGPLMYAVDYLKLDTTITYYVNKGNNASALYEWTISPSIPSFNDTIVPDTTLTIKWNGDTGIIYTFMVTPISLDSVCDGDPDTMFVKLYTNPINLPVQVSWVNTSDTVCSPVSGSATVAASIDVNYFSGTFTLSYQVDNDSEVTLPPSLVSPVTININSGLTAGITHYVRITRIETSTVTNQPITQSYSNEILLSIHMKPYPALGEISSENIVSTQQSRTQTACASGLPEKYSISGQAGMAYHWNTDLGHSVFKDSSGKVETDTLKNNILITWPSHAANHNLVVYGEAGGCFSLAKSLIVQVNNLPVVSLGGDVNLCQGQDHTFTIDGNYKSIKWPDQTTGDTYSTNKNDTVVVVVTDQKNCVGTDTAIVKVYPLPVVKLGKDTMLCGDHTLVLSAGNTGARYQWLINGNVPDQPLTTQTITIDKTYGGDLVSVTVTVAELPSNIDCSNSDTIRIIKCDTVFSKAAVPTAFTPNGDGYDDNWKIPGLNDQYKHAIVQVYDRWGRLVYQSTAGYPDPGWDGRDANGKYAPMDNYYYIINFNQNNIPSVVGSITIIR